MSLSHRSIMITFQRQFVNFRLLLNVCSLRLLSDSLNCPLRLLCKSSFMLEDSLLRLCGDILNCGGQPWRSAGLSQRRRFVPQKGLYMSPIDRWNGRGGRLSRKHLRRRRNRSRHRGGLLSLLGGSSRGHGGLGGRGMITGRRSRPLPRRTGLGRETTFGGTWGSRSGRCPSSGCRGSIAGRLTGRLWPDGMLLGLFDRPRRFRRTARRGGCAVTPSAATPWTI